MTQAVSRRPLVLWLRVPSQVSPCETSTKWHCDRFSSQYSYFFSPCRHHSTIAPHSPSACCCCQKDKRAKSGNSESNAVAEFGWHRIENYFHVFVKIQIRSLALSCSQFVCRLPYWHTVHLFWTGRRRRWSVCITGCIAGVSISLAVSLEFLYHWLYRWSVCITGCIAGVYITGCIAGVSVSLAPSPNSPALLSSNPWSLSEIRTSVRGRLQRAKNVNSGSCFGVNWC